MKRLLIPKAAASVAAALLVIPPAQAAEIVWDNPAEGAFLDDANWAGEVAPGGADTAVIGDGGTATVSGTDNVVIDQLHLNNGLIEQTGGLFNAQSTVNSPDEALRAFNVGAADGQSATYNASGSSVLTGGGIRIGFNGGTGVMNLSDEASYSAAGNYDVWLGNGANSHGTLNLTDDVDWTTTDALVVGRLGGTGVFQMSGESQFFQTGNNTYFGDGGGTTSTNTFSGGAEFRNTTGEIWIGQGGATTTMTIEDDAAVIAETSWIAVGRQGDGTSNGSVLIRGNGRLEKTGGADSNIVIGAGAIGAVTLQDNATLASNTQIWVGEGGGADGSLDVQSGTVTAGGDFTIGQGGGSQGDVTLSGGSVTVGGWTKLGFNATATGSMTISGTAEIETAGTFIIGDDGTGTLTMQGGIATTNGQTWVGQNGQGVGVFNMEGGSYTSASWIAVGRDGAKGTLDMSGGSLTHTGVGQVEGDGYFGSNFVLDGSAEEIAEVHHSGGSISNTASVLVIGAVGGGVGNWNATGGTAEFGDLRVGFNGVGTLTLDGTADYSATSVYLSSNGGSTGNLVLNGGSLTANFVEKGAGNASLTFNGGVLRARQASADFLPDFLPGDIEIQEGGMKFDTNTFDVGISHALAGAGGLVKMGEGALTLSGATTFSGFSTVEAGVLVIAASGQLGGVPHLAIAEDAALAMESAVSLNENIVLTLVTDSELQLNFEGSATIAALWINGEAIAPDVYSVTDLQGLATGVDFSGDPGALLNVTSTVPEPGTFALLACGAAVAMWRLRRRSR